MFKISFFRVQFVLLAILPCTVFIVPCESSGQGRGFGGGGAGFGGDDFGRPPRGLFGDDSEFEVGDRVQFRHHGEVVEGEVVGFTGTGWPRVEFEFRGDVQTTFGPASKYTRIDTDDEGDEDEDEMPAEAELRVWKDDSGKFEIEARLIEHTDKSIRIKKKDGRVVDVPLSKLSQDDKDYLARLAEQESEENPFAGGTPARSSKKKRKSASRSSGRNAPRRMLRPDPNDARQVSVQDVEWRGTPDEMSDDRDHGDGRSIAVESRKSSVHDRRNGLAVSADGSRIALSVSNAFESQTRIHILDTAKSANSFESRLPYKNGKLLAISPAGGLICSSRAGSGDARGQLDFWQIVDGDIKLVAGWATAGFHDHHGFKPRWISFVDEQHALSFGKRLVLWDWKTADPVYSVAVEANVVPGFSVHRKQIAVYAEGRIAILDVSDGSTLGSFAADRDGLRALAISDDGTLVAGISGDGVRVWDIADGELIREMTLPASIHNSSSLHWAGSKHLLVGEQVLVDVELRVVVWKYSKGGFASPLVPVGGGKFRYAAKSQPDTRVVAVSLPHHDLSDQTDPLDADELLVIKPGTRVNVKIDLPFAPDEQKKVIDHLKEELADSGLVHDRNASIVINCRVKKGEPKTINVEQFGGRMFGRDESESIKYTPTTSIVEVKRGEQLLWRRAAVNGPGMMIMSQDGETTAQAIKRMSQPRPIFFQSIRLPRQLARLPGGKESLGESSLSASGVR